MLKRSQISARMGADMDNREWVGIQVMPNPEEIIKARESAGLTQIQAAATIHAGRRTWQNWESGIRKMPASDWELFLLKTGQHPEMKIADA